MSGTRSHERLFVEDLRRQFDTKTSMGFSDFLRFYSERIPEIKEATVRAYINNLKELGVVWSIARGQYALNRTAPVAIDKGNAVVLTMDVINSSSQSVEVFMETIQDQVRVLNEQLKGALGYDRRFFMSRGDEIQLLCPLDHRLGRLLLLTLHALRPYKARYALSVGRIEGEVKDNSWDMNGEIFWAGRDALESIKREKDYAGILTCGNSFVERMVDNLLALVHLQVGGWTDKQWEAVAQILLTMDKEEALERTGISAAAFNKRLRATEYELVLRSFANMIELMDKRGVIGQC